MQIINVSPNCCYDFGLIFADNDCGAASGGGEGCHGSGGNCLHNDLANLNLEENFTWDEQPDGFGMLWPDDPDNTHPFTRAALNGEVEIVKDYANRSTFDPAAKNSQHALLAACRAGTLSILSHSTKTASNSEVLTCGEKID